jgi:hypothetical protein
MLGKLRRTYNRSLEEKQTMYLSKYRANRTIALWAVLLFFLYEVFATVYVLKTANLPVNKAMLFTMYTITSAGFGSVVVPKTKGFLVFQIFNIFISISGVAVLVRTLLIADRLCKSAVFILHMSRLPKLFFILSHLPMVESTLVIRYEWQIVDS